MSLEIDIDDLVSLKNYSNDNEKDGLFYVCGIISDSGRLFLQSDDMDEFEVPFSEVDRAYREYEVGKK